MYNLLSLLADEDRAAPSDFPSTMLACRTMLSVMIITKVLKLLDGRLDQAQEERMPRFDPLVKAEDKVLPEAPKSS